MDYEDVLDTTYRWTTPNGYTSNEKMLKVPVTEDVKGEYTCETKDGPGYQLNVSHLIQDVLCKCSRIEYIQTLFLMKFP